MRRGATCSPPTTSRCGASSSASVAKKSRHSATAFSPRSMGRHAQSVVASARGAALAVGLPIPVGIHTGECELVADDLAGITVHIAARVGALAQANEVLVSRTVKDLIAGSGITFSDSWMHRLKGLSDKWQLYAVTQA